VSDYQDGRIECTDSEVRIRGYYFPWGTKHIPYTAIRCLQRFSLSAGKGKGRIWGSGDLRHWANFDPRRPQKGVGFFLEVGGLVIPFVTPDQPDVFEKVLREHVRPGSAL
jgi:hypothetical protein